MARPRHLSLLAGVVLILGLAAGYAFDTLREPERGPRDADWERIQAAGVIRIGVDPSIPPFASFAEDDIIGLDPALGRAIAQELGVRAEFVPLSFDGLYDALWTGIVDMTIAALRPDPLRLGRVRYSAPYFDAGQSLLSSAGYAELSALPEGAVVGVEFASEGDLAARNIEHITLERFFAAQEALEAAERGDIQAALVDAVSARLYLSAQPASTLQMPPERIVPDPYVIAIRRDDWRLYGAVQAALSDLRARGELATLHDTWLHSPNSDQ